DGLRALLVPSNKRPTFGRSSAKRRRKRNLASIEFAGRWSILPRNVAVPVAVDGSNGGGQRETALGKFARGLLRRYGVVFRRLLKRESFPVNWYELGRINRRLEARGETRGGHPLRWVSSDEYRLTARIGQV